MIILNTLHVHYKIVLVLHLSVWILFLNVKSFTWIGSFDSTYALELFLFKVIHHASFRCNNPKIIHIHCIFMFLWIIIKHFICNNIDIIFTALVFCFSRHSLFAYYFIFDWSLCTLLVFCTIAQICFSISLMGFIVISWFFNFL